MPCSMTRRRKGLRISFNTKCLPTDESLEDFIARMEQPTKISPTVSLTFPLDMPRRHLRQPLRLL